MAAHTSTHDPSAHDDPLGRRTAVTWVTGTGAFLLLMAAGVFVGVRWDEIPPPVKLAILCALSGACLLVGHILRRSLPATGAAVFHLGALLVPLDVGAVAVHTGAGWPGVLLAVGATGALVFPVLSRLQQSTVLDRAWLVAVIATAAGVGATTDAPAGLVLAAAAVAADVGGLRRHAVVWAAVAGLSPLLASVHSDLLGAGVLHDLGVTSESARLAGVVTGALTAWVLGREAQRRADAGYALLALVTFGVGLATTWAAAPVAAEADAAGLAGLFLVIEVAATLLRRDVVWSRPLGGAAVLAEIGAAFGTLAAMVTVAITPLVGELDVEPDATAALAFGLLAAGWLAADIRRRQDDATTVGLQLLLGSGWAPATLAAAPCIVATVVWATGSALAGAAAMVGVAGLCLLSGRPLGHLTGAGLALWAPVAAASTDPWAAVVVGLGGAAVVAEMAVLRARVASPVTRPATALAAPALALAALGSAAVGALALGVESGPLSGLLVATAGAWLVAAIVDGGDRQLGRAVRVVGLGLLIGAAGLPPEEAAQLAAVISLLAIIDAVRLDDPLIAWGAAASVPVMVVTVLVTEGFLLPYAGVGLCVTAIVASGLAAVVDEDRWRWPFLALAVTSTAAGLGLASGDPRALADALLITGGLVLLAGVVVRQAWVGHVGGVLLIGGVWGHLAASGVVASEAYLAPVALQLVVAGMQARRTGTGSWPAYAPAVAMLGGAALAERLAGGPAWHALVAGAVGVAAVAAGGARRLAAPLLLGTVLCVAVAVYESLAVTAGVPTWGWLALGGVILLGAGVAMERADTTPLETGRRLVDVVTERFA